MISITVAGVSYQVPSSAADVDWAAKQVALEQALAAAIAKGPAIQRLHTNVVQVGNGANTTENNLMQYTLPGGTLAVDGQGVRVTAWGIQVSTADVQTLRAYFGSDQILDAILPSSQQSIWKVQFELMRTGAATQRGPLTTLFGATPGVQLATCTRTLASDNVLKFTGQRATTPSANSIIQYGWAIELIP